MGHGEVEEGSRKLRGRSLDSRRPQREFRRDRESEEARCVVGSVIDKKMFSTINKILIHKLSIRSFGYQFITDKPTLLSINS